MYNVATVTVVDCTEHLLDDVGSVLFAKVLFLSDLLEEFTTVAKLCD